MPPIDVDSLTSVQVLDSSDEIARCLHDMQAEIESAEGFETRTLADRDEGVEVVKTHSFSGQADFKVAPSGDELRRLMEQTGLPYREELSDRAIRYIASDERVDREGDIVRQNWDFSDFARNPVVVWSHDWFEPPIGNSVSWRVIDHTDGTFSGRALELVNVFATADDWPYADSIFRLVKGGFLRSSSVGFYPTRMLRIESEEERQSLGLGRFGVVYDAVSLVEHSPATVPANPGAVSQLRAAAKSGGLAPHDIEVIRELRRRELSKTPDGRDQWRLDDVHWRTAWGGVFSKYHAREHEDVEEPIELTPPDEGVGCVLAAIGDLTKRLESVETEVKTVSRASADVLTIVEGLPSGQETGAEDSGEPAIEHRSPLDDVLRGVVDDVRAVTASMTEGATDGD
jgi:hypothetical protein